MSEWKPDHRFLDFLLEKFENEDHLHHPLTSDESHEGHTKLELINAMRRGTEFGKEAYRVWHSDHVSQRLYQDYVSKYNRKSD